MRSQGIHLGLTIPSNRLTHFHLQSPGYFLQAARVSALIYTVVNKEAVRDTTPCLPVRPSRGWTLVAFRNRSPWRPINRFGLAQAAFAKPADCCIGIASACCLNGWSKAIRRSGAIRDTIGDLPKTFSVALRRGASHPGLRRALTTYLMWSLPVS